MSKCNTLAEEPKKVNMSRRVHWGLRIIGIVIILSLFLYDKCLFNSNNVGKCNETKE